MLEWLNHYAAAVQALAAVFSVIATLMLLRITRQYVMLTQELARAAREQIQYQRRTVASEAAQLTTLIDVFLGSLKHFPTGQQDADQLRTVGLWKHADVTAFGSLAASVLGTRTEVQRAIQRLNWLRTTAEQVQQQKNNNYQWHQFPWDEWKRHIAEAREALQTVRGVAQSAEPPTSTS